MYVESRPAGTDMEIRLGTIGRDDEVVGPMGIAICYVKDANLNNPFVNILIGVGALKGKNQMVALKRYNATFTQGYYGEVCRLQKRLKEDARCSGGD
jgi:hypothetical protein